MRGDCLKFEDRDTFVDNAEVETQSLNHDESGGVPDAITVEDIWDLDPEVYEILKESDDLETARKKLFDIFCRRELYLLSDECEMSQLERYNARECIRVFKNFLSIKNEKVSGVSTLKYLSGLAKEDPEICQEVNEAFLMEIYHLLRGAKGESGIYLDRPPDFLRYSGKKAATMRSEYLDSFADKCLDRIRGYPSGLDAEVIEKRRGNRQRILEYFGGKEDDWWEYRWQMKHVIRDLEPLQNLIQLTTEEIEAVRLAVENHVPFGITPYYLSLMDFEPHRLYDHAVRSQVIPPLDYVRALIEHRSDRNIAFDFMREHDTSPADLITRRYPMIAILKPYNTCAQICVYCQRNWEIDEVLSPRALAPLEVIEKAVEWFSNHPQIIEILVTGGDPSVMSDRMQDKILSKLAELDHVERIRIGTRTPVVMPMRITEELAEIYASYHDLPRREVCVVSHYEHPYEVTPESGEAVQRLIKRGIKVYNQQVFTIENSRRFETAALRLALRKIGVDPYYTFNAKGKEETSFYRVPIARLLQECKEEARVLPGIVRTDEPVFNIPALGKNHLRAKQHHEYIMLSPRGERYYEFHPWEKNITLADTYVYKDVPIWDYLKRLEERGENLHEYRAIWYYF